MMELYLEGLIIMLIMGVITWGLSLKLRDVSIVDSLWSLMFLAGAIVYVSTDSLGIRETLLISMISIWSIRLSVFLTVRNWGEAEDRRYQEIRANNEPFWIKSLYIVFGLQALLAWLISSVLLFALNGSAQIGVVEIIGILLWSTGFVFESIADFQLYRFKKDPSNEGRVLDSGLWRYSRHPNYFGEALIWWAFYLFAVQTAPWWIIFAPVLMTLLLLKVSGVALMEKEIVSRRPQYDAYIRRTNAFIPWYPRESVDPHAQNLGAS